MYRALCSAFAVLMALTVSLGFAAPGHRPAYIFTRVADSARDGFDPFSFECSAINNQGDIAFRTARPPQLGTAVVPGIYRANAQGRRLTTIAQDERRFDFIGQIPSINDRGEVSFAVRLKDFSLAIMQGSGGRLTTIATTADGFNQFGFEPTINDDSEVAFKAQLVDFDQGLFSGEGGRRSGLTTHYLASTSQFSEFGSQSRPSINNHGDIAFEELVDGVFASGIFVTEDHGFKTIAAPDPNVLVDRPNLNDAGTVTFHRFFNDRAGEELMKGNGGPLTIIADTNGPFQSFGFFFGFVAPALNNHGDVAFFADLDAGGSGVFVGPDPVADRVIGTGDRLDGSSITRLRFCDQGLNDHGQLAFQATFNDPSVPDGIRVAVYRATPAR